MHDSNGRKLLKLFNEACLLLNNGRIKNSYLIADNGRKISAISAWDCHLIHDNDIGYEMSALIIVLPKKSVRKFSDEFSKYVLQQDEFSKCVFH